MHAITTGAMPRTIISTTKFETLTIANNGMVLKYKKKKVSEIPFSELDKIYIKVYQLKPIYASIVVVFSILLAFLFFESIKRNIEMFVAILPVIPAFVKSNRFKRFGLVILLKDGSVFKKHVSKKVKSDTVELINEVKRKILSSVSNIIVNQKK